MRIKRTIVSVGVTGVVLLSTGCASFGRLGLWDPPPNSATKVTVRFIAEPNEFALASRNSSVRLASSDADTDFDNGDTMMANSAAYRVVLWGGEFEGEDVTFTPTQLSTGPYMFGLFDPDRGGSYQGWISVNSGGDDVLSALGEWQQSVQKQQEWLAYGAKVSGQFDSGDASDFASFEQNLRKLRRLEKKIGWAIESERVERRNGASRFETLAQAEVLIVPGGESFLRPWTQAALSEEDFSTVRSGTALTKFILVGDYETASGKLERIAELRDDLDRNRAVFNEEFRRLEHRRRYYLMTDHLYNHGRKFVQNEKRLQEARGMIAEMDRQIADYNQKFEAILFVTGLFAPDEALAQFDATRDGLDRDRAVIDARVALIENRIDEVSDRSERRVRLEQQRQDAQASIEHLDNRIAQIDQAQRAVRRLRDSTVVIHRQGPASVIAATMIDASIPPRFASAIEKESLLTLRLQAANGPNRLNAQQANLRTTASMPMDWNRTFRDND